MERTDSSFLPDFCGTKETSDSSGPHELKPENKRRQSGIFRRRSSIRIIPSPKTQERIQYEVYIAKTRNEITRWRNLYKQRKSAARKASERYSKLKSDPKPVVDLEDVKHCLTQEDLDFISKMPDFSKLHKAINDCSIHLSLIRCGVKDLNQLTMLGKTANQARLNLIESSVCSALDQQEEWVPTSNTSRS